MNGETLRICDKTDKDKRKARVWWHHEGARDKTHGVKETWKGKEHGYLWTVSENIKQWVKGNFREVYMLRSRVKDEEETRH